MAALIPMVALLLVIGVVFASLGYSRMMNRAQRALDKAEDYEKVLEDIAARLEVVEKRDDETIADLWKEFKELKKSFQRIGT